MKVKGVSSPTPSTNTTNTPQLHIYPIKALRGIPLTTAELTPQGLKHDRRFMLWSLAPDGSLRSKLQISSNPECALFSQEITADPSLNTHESTPDAASSGNSPSIVVRYQTPAEPLAPHHPSQDTPLSVPLEPDTAALRPVDLDMFGSKATAYRMGTPYDAWFSACLGYPAALLYIGDGRRPQLGFRPGPRMPGQNPALAVFAYISNLILYLLSLIGLADRIRDWLVFSDMAPFLVVSTSSLTDVASRVGAGPVEMHRFRPNIVLGPDPDAEDLPPWSEDFWSQLTISPSATQRAGKTTLQVTGNCCRCVAVNVDYATGRPSKGPLGTVFKKLMAYRRVDSGAKWEPVFGRYASLLGSAVGVISLGDGVEATTRSDRDVWDWPAWKKVKPKAE